MATLISFVTLVLFLFITGALCAATSPRHRRIHATVWVGLIGLALVGWGLDEARIRRDSQPERAEALRKELIDSSESILGMINYPERRADLAQVTKDPVLHNLVETAHAGASWFVPRVAELDTRTRKGYTLYEAYSPLPDGTIVVQEVKFTLQYEGDDFSWVRLDLGDLYEVTPSPEGIPELRAALHYWFNPVIREE